jgi:hypothetical protein
MVEGGVTASPLAMLALAAKLSLAFSVTRRV